MLQMTTEDDLTVLKKTKTKERKCRMKKSFMYKDLSLEVLFLSFSRPDLRHFFIFFALGPQNSLEKSCNQNGSQ